VSKQRSDVRGAITRAAAALLVSGSLVAVGIVATEGASQATGTMSCPNFSDTDVGTVDAGMTGYLVVGTSINTPDSTLTGSYTLNGATFGFSQPGVQNGQGSFHYIFQLPQGAVIVSWQVGGATQSTVITVSGCLNGTAGTTPSTPTTPGGETGGTNTGNISTSVLGAEVNRPAQAPTAVAVSPSFTG
jgi:hypothetical protein